MEKNHNENNLIGVQPIVLGIIAIGVFANLYIGFSGSFPPPSLNLLFVYCLIGALSYGGIRPISLFLSCFLPVLAFLVYKFLSAPPVLDKQFFLFAAVYGLVMPLLTLLFALLFSFLRKRIRSKSH